MDGLGLLETFNCVADVVFTCSNSVGDIVVLLTTLTEADVVCGAILVLPPAVGMMGKVEDVSFCSVVFVV